MEEVVPMDIDNDEGGENDNNALTDADVERMALSVVSKWLLQKTGKDKIRNINPWEGFISPAKLGIAVTRSCEYRHVFNIDQLKQIKCPLTISPKNSKSRFIPTKAGKGTMYDHGVVYPYSLVVQRWDNKSNVHLGVATIKTPDSVTDLMDKVMENIPGAVPGTFMEMAPGSTQDDYRVGDGEVKNGTSSVNRDFGVLNKKFLSAFGCIERRHLGRGCIMIPEDISLDADLQRVFGSLRNRAEITKSLFSVKNKKDTKDESNKMDIDDDNELMDKFILVPCTSLIAWGYDLMDDDKRAEFNVYALQIRSRNKKTNKIATPYWIVDELSFNWMVEYCNVRLVKDVNPISSDLVGLNISPFDAPGSWNNLMIYDDIGVSMTKDEINAVIKKKRSLYIKFSAGYVCFPRGTSERLDIAPILPPNWYDAREFKRVSASSGQSLKHNINQKIRK